MNKQELIERIKCLKNIFGNKTKYVEKDTVIKLISELDEPQKVKIPQFVADVIEEAREQSAELEDAFEYVWEVAIGELRKWFRKLENRDNFARAWLDGYEVEKEKRFRVKIKGILKANEVLNYKTNEGKWVISSGVESTFYRTKHTRKQLEEANFGWVFDCEGIEIEEVTE